MKKNLLKNVIGLLVLGFTTSAAIGQTNLIKNGSFGTATDWETTNLNGKYALALDFNFTTDGPTNGDGACLRLWGNDISITAGAIYQQVSVEVGKQYGFSMQHKDLGGSAANHWVEVLLSSVEPVSTADYGDNESVVTKIDGFSPCTMSAAYDGDLGIDHCDYDQYPNMVSNGSYTVVAESGESVGDIVSRYFVIKTGTWIGDGESLSIDLAIDEIKLIAANYTAKNLVQNNDFELGTLMFWQTGLTDTPTIPTGSVVGSETVAPQEGDKCVRVGADKGTLYQTIPVEAGETYDIKFYFRWESELTKNAFKFKVLEGTAWKIREFVEGNHNGWTLNEHTYTPEGTEIKLQWFKGDGFPAYYVDNISCIKKTPTAISDKEDSKFKIYPNPSYGTFEINSPKEILSYSVYNSTGSVVHKLACSTARVSVNLSNFAKGVYFIKCNLHGGEQNVQKIILK